MKATELRIGNITTFGKVYQIEADCFYVSDVEGISYKSKWADLHPIPLTEEWLVKFGVIEANDSHVKRIKLETDFGDLMFYIDNRLPQLKYVHQLQNLYFALTGEELTIKTKQL